MKLFAPLVRSKPQRSADTLAKLFAQAWGAGGWYQGSQYPHGVSTTMPGERIEPIEPNFEAYVTRGLKSNGIVWTCNAVRLEVFSQAQFKWQQMGGGRAGKIFGTAALEPLERPWPGGTTGQLLARMITDVDMAGNFYGVRTADGLRRLRPDWVDILLEPVELPGAGRIGWDKVGYVYYPEGQRGRDRTVLTRSEVVHFAPKPDPIASWRGMSWLTPVLREIAGDAGYSDHKVKFLENAATPNLAVSVAKEVTPEQFDEFVSRMDEQHKGVENTGKTLYLGGGSDVTVVGADMAALDFKSVQGAGETRIAAASGVGAVIAQLSEGMQGSSLNSGNYMASRRRFADVPMRHLWQEACGAIAAVDNPPIVTPPRGARLWYYADDIPFLQEDAKDAADIVMTNMSAIRSGVEAGFEPDSVVKAVDEKDPTRLDHTGVFSVQLQPPGEDGGNGDTGPATDNDDEEDDTDE